MVKPARARLTFRRAAALLTLTAVAASGLVVCAVSLLSPRSAGEPIAARRGIPYPAVIAHRGLSAWAPEETRPAYLLARAVGADYLEADVQRTRDGVLVALHDETLARTTDVAAVFPDRRDRGPAAFTWEELQRLDAGAWWNAAHPDRARPSYLGLRILRIEDLLALAAGPPAGGPDLPGRPGLYLETKDPEKYPGYEAELVALLRARGWLEPAPGAARVIFQSFDAASLARLRALSPETPRVLLLERPPWKAKDGGRAGWEALLRQAQELGAGLGPSGYEGMPWHTGPAHRAGLWVHHYTVNQAWQLWLLRQLGSDGVFTDTAELARDVLGRGGPGYDRGRVLRDAFQATGF